MTNRKSQNSILVLTTLGVYLGLVLVGATPQVLAQAATTRNFDISEEIGHVDNLDIDPGQDGSEKRSVAIKLRRSVSAFLAEFASVDICGASSKSIESRRQFAAPEPIITLARSPFRPSITTILSVHRLARASI